MSGFGYDVLGFGSGAGVAGPEVDDEFNRVSFLSHFDGANNGVNNVIDDGSASNHTMTSRGAALIGQGSFGPFARPEGEFSVHFDGVADYIQAAASSDFQLGSGDFTFEMWVFPTDIDMSSSTGSYGGGIIDFREANSATTAFGCHIKADGKIDMYTNTSLAEGGSVTEGVWSHLAWVRISNVIKGYVNGSQVFSFSNSTNWSSGRITIASNIPHNNDFQGSVSNVRVVKGTGVYTGGFTPPTSALTAITGTVLLTCQSNRFVDNSASAHALTPSGNAAVSAFGPFLTDAVYDPAVNGASTYFSGAEGTAIIITDDLTDFQFGTGAFTVEGWVYRIGGGSAVYTIHQTPVASGSYVSYGSSGKFVWGSYGNGDNADNTTSTVLANNQWIHFAVVRTNTNSNGLKIYINGVVDGTFTDTSDYDDTPYNPRIGGFDQGGSRTGNDINAYICDIRVVKGTAVYTGDFTPPTAPLTAITNTKLLLNMADGQAIDSAAQREWTSATVWQGAPKLATAQSKFGDTSLYFNNASIYTIPAGWAPQGGTADYTMEFWWRTEGTPGTNATLFMDSNQKFFMQFENDGNVHMWADDADLSQSFSVNTWYHAAFVRNGSTVNWYHNGTAVGSGLSVGTMDTLGTLYMGGQPISGGRFYFQGWVDEMRISRFARYTNNFTPPTEPFPDQGQV